MVVVGRAMAKSPKVCVDVFVCVHACTCVCGAIGSMGFASNAASHASVPLLTGTIVVDPMLVCWLRPHLREGMQLMCSRALLCAGAIVVDPMLVRWLRPHQREGVQFMFECVAGLRLPEGQGECVRVCDVDHNLVFADMLTYPGACLMPKHIDHSEQEAHG